MTALFDLYAAHPFWIWAAAAALILAVEVASGTGWLLWPAASALAVGVLSIVAPLSPPWELLIFAAVTIVSTLLARRYLPRLALSAGGDINDNVARLVGQQGYAASSFVSGAGRAFVDGKEWAAELEGEAALDAGGRLVVVAVNGAVLRVRASP
jgi:membrane protein implicated in regulation of membrane protease activity